MRRRRGATASSSFEPEQRSFGTLGAATVRFANGQRVQGDVALAPPGIVRCGNSVFRVASFQAAFEPAESVGPLVGGTSLSLIRRTLRVVGPTPLSLLILGETGTGKEVVARAIHDASGRRGPFVPVNCATLPEQLVESELFGHAKGSFTGAERAHTGLFEAASGGTIFLDEVADLPLAVQPKLLRVLEDGMVRRVGAKEHVQVDVRVVSATNRDLELMRSSGSFRPDLFARLAEVDIRLPALRERREDIPALADYLLRRSGHGDVRLSAAALEVLLLHDWSLNVRELDAALRRATLELAGRLQIESSDLHFLRAAQPAAPPTGSSVAGSSWSRAQVETTLQKNKGNVRRSAAELGVSRTHLYRLMKAMDLDATRFR